VTASVRSPEAIVVSAQVGRLQRVREHEFGDVVHRLGERPWGAGPEGGPPEPRELGSAQQVVLAVGFDAQAWALAVDDPDGVAAFSG